VCRRRSCDADDEKRRRRRGSNNNYDGNSSGHNNNTNSNTNVLMFVLNMCTYFLFHFPFPSVLSQLCPFHIPTFPPRFHRRPHRRHRAPAYCSRSGPAENPVLCRGCLVGILPTPVYPSPRLPASSAQMSCLAASRSPSYLAQLRAHQTPPSTALVSHSPAPSSVLETTKITRTRDSSHPEWRMLNSYRVGDTIGHGQFGKVKLGVDVVSNKDVVRTVPFLLPSPTSLPSCTHAYLVVV